MTLRQRLDRLIETTPTQPGRCDFPGMVNNLYEDWEKPIRAEILRIETILAAHPDEGYFAGRLSAFREILGERHK